MAVATVNPKGFLFGVGNDLSTPECRGIFWLIRFGIFS